MALKRQHTAKSESITAPQVEELEARLLLSADPVGAFVPDNFSADPVAIEYLLDENLDAVAPWSAVQDTDDERLELVFVDTDTPEYQQLIDDLLTERNDGRRIDVHVLDNDRDGITQISETLATLGEVDAIHIISHGADGSLDLGSTQLSNDNLADYQQALQGWGAYLDADADILIYGCNLAASAEGQLFTDRISFLTGADIASSDDLTGSAALGGDWNLEYKTGAVETSTVIDNGFSWAHTLNVVTNQAPWANVAVSTDRSTTISTDHTVTATPGSDRILLVTMVTRFGFDQTIDVTSASFGGVQLHEIEEGSSLSTRNGVWMGYLLDSEIPTGTQTLSVSMTSTVSDPTGTKLLAATYVGVDQTNPVNDSSSNNTKADAPITFGSQIDYQAGAEVVYVASYGGNSNTNTTEPAGYSQIYTNELSGLLMTTISHKDDTSTAGSSPGSTAVDFQGTDANHSLVVVALNPVPAANVAPTITSTAGTTATEDTLYTYTAAVTDPDDANNGTDLTWSLSGEPAGMVVSSTGVVTWTPTEGVTTSGAVTLTVSDGNEDGAVDATEVFTITVTPVNDAPTITSTASTTATEDTLYTYTATVSDPDDANNGTDLTWSLSGAPAGMVVSSTGVVTWTPAEGVTTSGAVTLTVSDGNEDGAVDATEVFTITVVPGNSAPTDLQVTDTNGGGTSLNADGGNDTYFVADNGSALLGGLTQITIEATFSVDTPATDNTVLLSYASGSNDEELALFIKPDGRIWLHTHSNGSVGRMSAASYPQLLDGKVHHVAASWDASNGAVEFYVDGVAVESFTGYQTLQTIAGAGQLVFGQDQDTVLGGWNTIDVFSGTLYDIRIFNDVRTSSEITDNFNQTLAPTESGMIANWIFDDLAGGIVTDTVSGNNLTEQHIVATGFSSSIPELALGVYEGSAFGTVIGTVAAEDPDSGETFLYSLTDNAGGRFLIDDSSGQITLVNPSLIDFESNSSHDITVEVEDSGGLTYEEVFTVNVLNANDAPVVTNTGTQLAYAENDGAVVVDSGLTVSDADSADLTGATVSILGGFESAEDTLAFVNQLGIVGSYNTGTGVLTLSGTSSVANYQTALRSIAYANSSETPDITNRIVNFQVSDGAASGGSARTITVESINDAPVLDNSGVLVFTPITEDALNNNGNLVSEIIASDGGNRITDIDAVALEGIGITSVASGNGTWQYSIGAGWVDVGTVSFVETLLLRDTDRIRFVPDGENADLATVTFSAWDQTSGAAGTKVDTSVEFGGSTAFSVNVESATITVTAVNDAPTITSTAGTAATEETLYTYTATVSDPDDANNGTDLTWSLSGAPAGMVVSSTGVVTWTPAEGVTSSGPVTLTVSDGNEDGAVDATEVFTITVTPVNDAPQAATDAAVTDEGTPVNIDVLDNDTDAEGDPMFVIDVGNAANGTVVNNGDGTVTYTPDGGFTGADSFDYLVSDLHGLTSYWALDGDATDSVGGNNGTITGTTTVAGAIGDALSFDKVDDRVVVPNFAINDSFSLSFQIKVDDNSGADYQYIYSHGPVNNANSLNIFIGETGSGYANILYTQFNDSNDIDDRTALEFDVSSIIGDGEWHTYTLTVETGSGSAVYLDGTLQNTDARGGDSFTPTTDIYFGGREDLNSNRFFGGSLDSVQIFDRALHASEVSDVHTGGTSLGAVNITVNNVPVANDDSGAGFSTTEDLTSFVTGNVLTNDDLGDLPASVSTFDTSSANSGTVSYNGDGTFTYTPDTDFNGSDTFTYTISDADSETSTATVTISVSAVNDSPTITSTAPTTATEDTLYTYTATVSDPDDANNGTDLTWSLSGAPAGMVVSSTGVVTWTPAEGVTTSGAVTLTVSDGNEDGAMDATEMFTITVTPVNDAPTITSTAGTTATEDTLYTYTATVTDPDDANNGTDLTWSLSGAPTGMVVSSTGVVTWTPAEGVTTSGAVTLTVSDGNENGAVDATEVFTITVTPVNEGPTITSTAGTTATEDTLYTYTATVTDPDDANNGTDLTWSLSGAPAGMVVSSTGVVTWTPAEGVTTSGAVTLTVSDGNEDGALDDTEVFTITVTPVNDGPTITSTAGTTATEGSLYTYTATVSDPDDANNGTDLTWSLSGAPAGMVVSSTGVVTWTPAEGVTSSGSVTLTVSDGNEDGAVDATEVFTVTVTSVNNGPTITSTAGTTATEETLYTYTATVSDPDDANNGTDLTWSLSGAPAGMVVSSTGVVTWTPAEGVTSSGSVTLTVSDGNEDGTVDATEVFTITVTPVNVGPTITSTAGTTATEDTLYTYTATVSDPDDANNGTDLTWSLSGAPAGMVVSSTGVVTWTPTEGVTSSGPVTLTVSDGNEDGAVDATEVFTITVTPVNVGPTITSTAGTTATEETLYTYTATVTDPDDANNGTDLTWSLSGAPAGMVVSSTGVVTWTPAAGVTTSGAVTLTVSDGNEDGAVDATEVFTITVTPVNVGPTITSTAGTTATEDTLYTYTATVSDPDDANNGTDLTWSLSGAPAGMVVSSTGVVTWTPAEGVTSSGPVTLTVSDGNEDGAVDATEVFTITVTPVNDGPTITSTAGTTATEETLYTYTATVSDPDDANNGTDLTWSLSGAPAGMVVSSTGVVTWTPAAGVTTSGAVTLTVSDGNEDGAVDATEVFTITVTPVNVGPTITSTAGTTATEDTLYTYTATVTDPDDANNGTDLTWSLSGAPAGMVVSSTGVVTWTPAEGVTSSGPVTLTVSDGNEYGAVDATEVFTITVTPVNDAPIITSTAGTTATEDTLYTYTATVSDPDDANNGTDLTWSLSGAPAGMVLSSTGVVTWTPAGGVTSSGPVTLTVSDGNEDGAVDATEVFTITVTPLNEGPIITSTAGTSATEDTLYTYTATVSDPDDANNGTDLTWSLSGAPAGMVVSSTGVVTWTPAEGVTTSGAVTLTVSDGNEDGAVDATEVFTITVTPVNDAPTGSVIIDSVTPKQGDLLTASNDLADADGLGTITYQWLRDGALLAGETSDQYALTQTDVGANISVIASYVDNSGMHESVSSAVIGPVLNRNDLPTGAPVINGISAVGETLTAVTSSIADLDGLGDFNYDWQRSSDGGLSWDAVGSGDSYTLVESDSGAEIRVKVSYIDGYATLESLFSYTMVLPGTTPIEPNEESILPTDSSPSESRVDHSDFVEEPILSNIPSDNSDGSGGSGGNVPAANKEEASRIAEREDKRIAGSTRTLLPEQSLPKAIKELIEAAPQAAGNFAEEPVREQAISAEPQTRAITRTELDRVVMSSSSTPSSNAELRHVEAVLNNPSMWQGIEAMKREMDKSDSAQDPLVVEVVSTTGVGLMAGLVAYGLRGGALMASLMSTMPLWQAYDPLPILSTKRKDPKRSGTAEAADSEEEQSSKIDILFE